MTKDFLIDGISNIDEDLIMRFINLDSSLSVNRSRRRLRRIQTRIISAACVALAFGIALASFAAMRMMGVIRGNTDTTDIVTQDTPFAEYATVTMENEKIDLNSDGINDKILIKTNNDQKGDVIISVVDGKTDEEIWSEVMPISENQRYAYYFSNRDELSDCIICWSYSFPDGRESIVYRCRMFTFTESNEMSLLADTEYTFRFDGGRAPYESEEEYLSMLLLNLNKNLNSNNIKGYIIADNTGEELKIHEGESLRRKQDIHYTLIKLLERVPE